ncbi:hypothetical protein [Streptomyces sp. NPDC088725]|uniref:hypothetical protein n=1 Tax=Streptomyces sp. NPDC088725 TaxID=3365873 RepID=UPI00381F5380
MTALALTGLVVWYFWPSKDPVVAIPQRVCGEKLSGKIVSELLPKTGSAFNEDVDNKFELQDGRPAPTCILWAGDRGITLVYYKITGSDFVREWRTDYKRKAEQSEFRTVTGGNTVGYSGSHSAGIIADCTTPEDEGIVAVSAEGPDFPDEENEKVRKNFATLAAETLRVAAQDILKCPGAGALPAGAPEIGS